MTQWCIKFQLPDNITLEYQENNVVKSKKILPKDMLECLSNSRRKAILHTGILPPGCVCFSELSDGGTSIIMEYPENTIHFIYKEWEFPSFPVPRLLMGFFLNASGNILRIHLGVPDLGPLTPKTQMFFYPFSNVNGFSLCWGSNQLPAVKDFSILPELAKTILEFPNNDDYYSNARNKAKMEYGNLIDHLKDKDREYYYKEVLIPMKKDLEYFCLSGLN